MVLISFRITAQLIGAFVFTYAKSRLSHEKSQFWDEFSCFLVTRFTYPLTVFSGPFSWTIDGKYPNPSPQDVMCNNNLHRICVNIKGECPVLGS